jgi:hypothetical protein
MTNNYFFNAANQLGDSVLSLRQINQHVVVRN